MVKSKLQLFLFLGLISLGSLTCFAQQEIDYFNKKNELNIQIDNIINQYNNPLYRN